MFTGTCADLAGQMRLEGFGLLRMEGFIAEIRIVLEAIWACGTLSKDVSAWPFGSTCGAPRKPLSRVAGRRLASPNHSVISRS